MSVRTADLSAATSSGRRGIERLRVGLLAQRQEDALLAGAAVEVGRGVARARVAQRLLAVHVLEPARDVQALGAPGRAGELVVDDRAPAR